MLPIYYINTTRRTDRRDFMEQQFSALGLPGQRFEAITADQVPEDLVQRYCIGSDPTKLSVGELACTLSHHEVWRQFLASDAAAAVIFEDDGMLSRELPSFLQSLGDEMPVGIDVIKLETMRRRTRLGARRERVIGKFKLKRLLGTHYGACGYIISRSVAERALADPKLNDFIIDCYLFARTGPVIYRHAVYQVTPALSVQLSTDPDSAGHPAQASDLDLARDKLSDSRRLSRWPRLTSNLRMAINDLLSFGNDWKGLRGPRHDIPFAGD